MAERITALVDGELPAAERPAVEAHLAGCAACREARAAEEAVAARLRAAPRPALPPGFAAGVMDRVRSGQASEERPAGRILPLWPWIAAGAAVAAAVLAMVAVGTGGGAAGRQVAGASPAAAEKPVAMEARGDATRERRVAGEEAAGKAKDQGLVARDSVSDEEERRKAADALAGVAAGNGSVAARKAPKAAEEGGERRAETEAGTPREEARSAEAAAPAAGPPAPPKAPAPAPPSAEPVPAPAPTTPPPEREREGLAGPAGQPEGDKAPRTKGDKSAETETDRDAGDLARHGTKPRAEAPAKAAAPPPPVQLFFATDLGRSGQQAIEHTLFADGRLVQERGAWTRLPVQPELLGRLLARQQQSGAFSLKEATQVAMEDTVLRLRVRVADVEPLRMALQRVPGLTEIPAPAGEAGVGGGAGGGAGEKRSGGGDEKGPGPAEASGADRPAPPGDSSPPKLSPEALRRLAEPPPPAAPAVLRPTPKGEVWVEIHLVSPPAPAVPPGR
jgi:hypothetical protein